MPIQQLTIHHLRNLSTLRLELAPSINLIYGSNGSGKTSVLEGIHLLSHGRSFRTSNFRHYIQAGEERCTLHSQCLLDGTRAVPLASERHRDGSQRCKVAGQAVESAAELARLLPVQLINADSFQLLEGSPGVRRQFFDWGVFHAEPRFIAAWRAVKRCLQQRNSLLKYGRISDSVRGAWDQEFIRWSTELDGYRAAYLERLLPVFERLLGELIALDGLTLSYYRGWDSKRTFEEVLADGFQRDLQLGYTLNGPQRADLRVRVRGVAAAEILSRGQQKLVVSALKVAQGYLLQELTQRSCVYLIDDLPAELDAGHRRGLCRLLENLQCQVLITCVDPHSLAGCWQEATEVKGFRLEQGVLAPPSYPMGVSE